jgi:type IV pilus assembly protein PilV
MSKNAGFMLLEALLAIVIFSFGVLALVGLQAFAVKATSDAKYRSDAALLANQLIGQMWTSNRTQATLQTNFSSPSGVGYQAWAGTGGTNSTPAAGTVLQALPGAQAANPTVVIAPITTTAVPTSLVTITIFWQPPNDPDQHKYVTVAQIGG